MAKIPIACTLTDVEARDQVAEWQALHDAVVDRAPVEGGIALTFPDALHDTVADLAAREAGCCGFLTLVVERCDGRIRLTITSDQADATPVIEALAGVRSL